MDVFHLRIINFLIDLTAHVLASFFDLSLKSCSISPNWQLMTICSNQTLLDLLIESLVRISGTHQRYTLAVRIWTMLITNLLSTHSTISRAQHDILFYDLHHSCLTNLIHTEERMTKLITIITMTLISLFGSANTHYPVNHRFVLRRC